MPAILSILPLIQSAIGIIGTFNGSAQMAKNTGYVQGAIGVITKLTPLVQQFGAGKEVTPDDVRLALAGMDAAISEFDALIAAKSAPGT